ncbi:MAG: element excision factor XisI family protein [Bacteroidota bacterium]
MDKIKKYQVIIQSILKDRLGFPTKEFPHLKDELLISEDKMNFVQITYGWNRQQQYTNFTAFHIELNQIGKVLIHQNKTDLPIDELLVEKGVLEIDILDGLEATIPEQGLKSKAA